MLKTKDSIVVGFLAGCVGNIVKEAMAWTFYFLGWTKYTFVHIAAGFYYSKENLNAPLSLVTGAITDWTIAGTFGVLLFFFSGGREQIMRSLRGLLSVHLFI